MPSIREAAEDLELDVSNVHYHIRNLEKMGLMVRTGGHRGVRLVSPASKVIPFLGTVACGEPIAIFEEVDENVQVPENMILNGYAHYALRARGDSMINAGIKDGDVLVIRKQEDADDGDIAVVAIGDPAMETATLKTIYHKKDALLLKPENDDLEPYVVRNGEVRGKLVGVVRSL